MKFLSDKISIRRSNGKTSVVILARSERWKEALLLFWLLAWTFSGMVFLFYFFADTPYRHQLPLLVLIFFWLYFELKAVKAFIWRRNGYERLTFSGETLILEARPLFFGKPRRFDLREIEGITKISQSEKNFFSFIDASFWSTSGERLVFNYRGKDIVFGKQINDEECTKLIGVLNNELKKRKSALRRK